ncbi:chlorhexidine efflux transporter [Vibrio agarivorans]|uniref:Chlorhexidine efflux transporter n=1 Tax=Vibrio agarivorans TaxID=153622 RepID=A0ABT7XYJ0_9VIBR|nr:chlorhexidine efflux transporter [Vibrio agarivorans]MDN2480850.1 chlorhexidine efflux transporter [Vibrio agarivorans]
MLSELNQNPVKPLHQRIKNALIFEVGALLIITPTFLVHRGDISVFAAMVSLLILLAIAWNTLFNYLFDCYLWTNKRSRRKSKVQRCLHAGLFQLGISLISTPIFIAILDTNQWGVFSVEIIFSLLVFAYAFVTNFIYEQYLD